MPNRLHIALALACCLTSALGYTWPDLAYDWVEEFIWKDLTNFADIPPACGPDASNPDGTSFSDFAEWLRFAYHDMAPADNGVGGLDGSIIHELDRTENPGKAGFGNTFGQLSGSAGKYLSFADVIAAGAVIAVQQCGGPVIPFRVGRVTASGPGPLGVPQPNQTLADHTAAFARMGFNATEMIQLVACGHTLGGVNQNDLPDIYDGGNFTNPVAPFDDSRNFDNHIATNYINGPDRNPLVVGPNIVNNSDARIFASDGNVTMQSFADSSDLFRSTCANMLGRMIDVVPSGVTLSDVILPIPFKPRDYLLSINPDGTLNLRLVADIFGPSVINNNRVVTLHWADRQSTSCASGACSAAPIAPSVTATLGNGNTMQSYPFSVNVSAASSFSSFWFTVDEEGDGKNVTTQNNGGGNYPVDDMVVNVPAYTCSIQGALAGARITTAVRADGSTPAPSQVTVETTSVDGDTQLSTLFDSTAELGTAPFLSPIPEYVYYTVVSPEPDPSIGCTQMSFEFSATIGGVVHRGPMLNGPCSLRTPNIANAEGFTCMSCTGC
ncbi:heme peroxidase [Mycena sanguinolenta]|nr:heme peroxidase [Mycena sanguinolenta]